jgi:hypothetical protein
MFPNSIWIQMKNMSDLQLKKFSFKRIGMWSLINLPSLLLLWVVLDLFFFSLVPWQFSNDYLLLKESIFWKQYVAHCTYFEPKWITSILWHSIWVFSLLGIKMKTKYEQRILERKPNVSISLESMKNTSEKVKFSNVVLQKYTYTIQLLLLTVGTYILKFKKHTFVSSSGNVQVFSIWLYLVLTPPFSILPPFLLSKIISRRSFQNSERRGDKIFIGLLIILLAISTIAFGRVLVCG